MADSIKVVAWGQRGVNVGLNPLELDESDLLRSANAISDAAAGVSSLRKRPGLLAFTTTPTAGAVLGGVDLPLQDLLTGTRFLYIGRGPL
jgi:hypothetical protein